jgi:hypothetical protein
MYIKIKMGIGEDFELHFVDETTPAGESHLHTCHMKIGQIVIFQL